ncbi:hypothetical protein DUZ99_11300 [Xylanibacillus composti]|nr:hypothetical protein [Xylanibacillus composti]
MATITRGKVLRTLPARGRGECPLCKRTGIKLLYEFPQSDGSTLKVCKNCRPPKKLRKHRE